MGLIKAAAGALGGTLADSWKDYLQADNMDGSTVMTTAVQVKSKRSSNKYGEPGIITEGSRIVVGPNQFLIVMNGGKVSEYTAESGYYTMGEGSPSLFNGDFGAALRDSWERFKFGGQPARTQTGIFINLQEIKGIKFGTPAPIQYFDNFYNSELFLRCHGVYSIKITDPIKFFYEVCPRNASRVQIDDINEQYLSEFLNALQASISQMSVEGIRISTLPAQGMNLSKHMADVLDEAWKNDRGFEIKSVGIASISYDEDSKNLINMRNRGAMLSDPVIREGYVQGSIAEGMNAAGKNPNGAGMSFMGMGMGMNAGGGFMQSASNANMAQYQAQQVQKEKAAQEAASADAWKCSCGKENKGGKFCQECGKPRPVNNTWKCVECGTENSGNFCQNCGAPRPTDGAWKCQKCGNENNGGKFCQNCGSPRGN